MSLLQKYMEDSQFKKLMVQGELIMEVTETLCELIEKEGITRKELAERLGKSKGFVSQLLNGGRNLTLRTLADILHVLGYKISLSPEKIAFSGKECRILLFPQKWGNTHKESLSSWNVDPTDIPKVKAGAP